MISSCYPPSPPTAFETQSIRNACKFTPPGGKLTIATRLVLPSPPQRNGVFIEPSNFAADADAAERALGSDTNYSETIRGPPEIGVPAAMKDQMVVRIEVVDTGWGIKPREMQENKLFCACPFASLFFLLMADFE